MNYARIVIAAVAAVVVDAIYGFVAWGQVLSAEFGRYPGIYRSSADQTPYLPLMFVGVFVGMLFASWIYAKGYEGGSGLIEGARFGVVMGLLIGAYMAGVNYGILMPMSRKQESEADHIGLVLMALAGYDPHAAITLWERLASLNKGKKGPEWLSTHPTDDARIADLKNWLPDAMKYYRPRD